MKHLFNKNRRGHYLYRFVSVINKTFLYLGRKVGAVKATPKCTCAPIYTLGRPESRSFGFNPNCSTHAYAERAATSFTNKEKTYHSFSGVDCHFILVPHDKEGYLGPPTQIINKEEIEKYFEDNPQKIVLEVQGISFTEHIAEENREVVGYIVATFFDEDPLPDEYFKGDHDILLRFQNEYGHAIEIRLTKVRLKERALGIINNNLMLEMNYTYTASSVEFSKQK